jgi:hypothetical protein
MALRLEPISPEDYARVNHDLGGSLYFHPRFIESNRGKAERLVHLALLGADDAPLTAFPVACGAEGGQLTFSASFTDFGFRSLKVLQAIELGEQLVQWARREGLPSLRVILPPHFYGEWVPLMQVGLRSQGFSSELLNLALGLPLDRLAEGQGLSKNQLRDNRALTRQGLTVRCPADPAEALAWVGAYYEGLERRMSVPPQTLLDYWRAGLPVKVFEALMGQERIFGVVFYQFRDVLLWMFAGRAQGLKESPMAWFLVQAPSIDEMAGVSLIDLGNSGNTSGNFDFRNNGVLGFKDRFSCVYGYRDTLVLKLEGADR